MRLREKVDEILYHITIRSEQGGVLNSMLIVELATFGEVVLKHFR